jgi:thiol-disulfide isomerase/thioredoxin
MKMLYRLFFVGLVFANLNLLAQKGFDIKINFKGCNDTTIYLARYFFDQLPIVDSCKSIKNGKIQFKGDMPLEKGVYFLANQSKSSFYFQFIVDANQKFTINADMADMAGLTKSPDDKLNEQFFSYVAFMSQKGKEMNTVMQESKKKSKTDSAKYVSEKQTQLTSESNKFDLDFKARNKGSFVYDLMEMKTEKYATDVPKASNGRPDSLYQFHYYKSHYFDGTNFKDDRILYTPFFAERLKKYFDQIVVQHPDSVIKELSNVLDRCVPGSQVFNTLVGHFTYKYETNKAMSFDANGNCNTFEKVFIHLADKYIVSGKTNGYYSDETVQKIKERIDILRNLLPGAKVADLYMIDTTYGKTVLKMGFDTARTSASATYLYNKNSAKLTGLYKNLYSLNAKYTILVFWAADCGHCQTEIPKLHKDLMEIKNKIDFKVYAVQTKEELYDTWKKFILEKNLTDFTHVFDPIHINNLKEKFDIVGTPVIYLLNADKKIIAKKLVSEQTVDIIKTLEEIEKNKTSRNKN